MYQIDIEDKRCQKLCIILPSQVKLVKNSIDFISSKEVDQAFEFIVHSPNDKNSKKKMAN